MKLELRKTILAFDVFEKWGIDVVGPLPITCNVIKIKYTIVEDNYDFKREVM